MIWQLTTEVYIMLGAGAVSLTVASLTFRRGRVPGSDPLGAITLTGTFWAWTAALEVASGSLGAATFFHKLSFLGMEAVGIAWFAFAAEYAGRDRWITRNKLIALCALPMVTTALIWTDRFHHLVFRSLHMEEVGGHLFLQKTPAVWWWIDSAYTYTLLVGGILILGYLFVRAIGLYRRQILALLAGVVAPMAADIVYVQGVGGAETVNWAPAFFAWVGLVLYWGFARYQLLDVTPVAREFVTEHMGDALIVTDTQDRATYFNLAAEKLLGTKLRGSVGKPMTEVMAGRPSLRAVYEKTRNLSGDNSQEWEYLGRYYDARVSTLEDNRGRARGIILVLRDTTLRKVAELALDDARQKLEERVMERTAELAAEKEHLARLNEVAVEIARCVTSADVLNAGVRLARAAVGSEAGTLWLHSRKAGNQLLGNEGLPRDTWQTLRHVLETSAEVDLAMTEGIPVCIRWPDSGPDSGVSGRPTI